MTRIGLSLLALTLLPAMAGAQESRCGRATGGDTIRAGDALFVLQTAVGARQCDLCICDVDGSESVVASDALVTLNIAVGIDRPLSCVACGGATIGIDGGVVSSSNGGLDLVVPPGALQDEAEISVVMIDSSGLPDTDALVAPVYQIEPEATSFAIPATVSVAIDPATDAGSVVAAVTFDEVAGEWVPLDSSRILASNVLGPTAHLSRFSAAKTPTAPGCENLWQGAPGTVAPLHTVGGITVTPGVKTREDVVFSGPSELSLGSTWTTPSCSVNVAGSFGPGLNGNGAWIDYVNGGGTDITGTTGGAFVFTLTHEPPNDPHGPHFGVTDPCNASIGVFAYNLNVHFAADCTNLCAGVTCNDNDPCTNDLCDPTDGACDYIANSSPCGSTGAGMCVQGMCIVEVPMNVGASGDSLCAIEGLTCDSVPVLSPPEAACVAFNPSASVTFDFNGFRQAVYCNDNEGLACSGKLDNCHHCPACRTDALTCATSASTILERLYASCVP
jgi:hypothetical protein